MKELRHFHNLVFIHLSRQKLVDKYFNTRVVVKSVRLRDGPLFLEGRGGEGWGWAVSQKDNPSQKKNAEKKLSMCFLLQCPGPVFLC